MERERKIKEMEKLLNRETFQINLKRNDNQSGLIFMNTQCIVGSPEGKHLFQDVSYLSHFTTRTVVFYVY